MLTLQSGTEYPGRRNRKTDLHILVSCEKSKNRFSVLRNVVAAETRATIPSRRSKINNLMDHLTCKNPVTFLMVAILIMLTSCSGSRKPYYFSTYKHGHRSDSVAVNSDSASMHVSQADTNNRDTLQSLQPDTTITRGSGRQHQNSREVKSQKSTELKAKDVDENQKKKSAKTRKSNANPNADGGHMTLLALFLGLTFLQSGSIIVLAGAVVSYIAGLVFSIRGIKRGSKKAKVYLFILLLLGLGAGIFLYELITMPSFGVDPFSGMI